MAVGVGFKLPAPEVPITLPVTPPEAAITLLIAPLDAPICALPDLAITLISYMLVCAPFLPLASLEFTLATGTLL